MPSPCCAPKAHEGATHAQERAHKSLHYCCRGSAQAWGSSGRSARSGHSGTVRKRGPRTSPQHLDCPAPLQRDARVCARGLREGNAGPQQQDTAAPRLQGLFLGLPARSPAAVQHRVLASCSSVRSQTWGTRPASLPAGCESGCGGAGLTLAQAGVCASHSHGLQRARPPNGAQQQARTVVVARGHARVTAHALLAGRKSGGGGVQVSVATAGPLVKKLLGGPPLAWGEASEHVGRPPQTPSCRCRQPGQQSCRPAWPLMGSSQQSQLGGRCVSLAGTTLQV